MSRYRFITTTRPLGCVTVDPVGKTSFARHNPLYQVLMTKVNEMHIIIETQRKEIIRQHSEIEQLIGFRRKWEEVFGGENPSTAYNDSVFLEN